MHDDSVDERRAAARANAAASSEWWSPMEQGDRIEGEVTEVTSATSDRGKVYTVLVVQLDGGQSQKVGCARTVLADKVSELGVEAGDYISIRYDGERTSKGGTPYFAYTVGKA